MYKIPHCKVLRYWKRQFFSQYRPTVTSKTKKLERKCKSSTNDCNDSRSVSSYSGWCITMIAGFLCSCFFFRGSDGHQDNVSAARIPTHSTLSFPLFWTHELKILQDSCNWIENLARICNHLGTRMHSIERLLSRWFASNSSITQAT